MDLNTLDSLAKNQRATDSRLALVSHLALLDSQGQILLTQKFNQDTTKYSMIYGMAGHERSVADSLIEAANKIGIKLLKSNLAFKMIVDRRSMENARSERIDLIFEAREWSEDNLNKTNNDFEFQWFNINDLPSNTDPLVKFMFRHGASSERFFEYVPD